MLSTYKNLPNNRCFSWIKEIKPNSLDQFKCLITFSE